MVGARRPDQNCPDPANLTPLSLLGKRFFHHSSCMIESNFHLGFPSFDKIKHQFGINTNRIKTRILKISNFFWNPNPCEKQENQINSKRSSLPVQEMSENALINTRSIPNQASDPRRWPTANRSTAVNLPPHSRPFQRHLHLHPPRRHRHFIRSRLVRGRRNLHHASPPLSIPSSFSSSPPQTLSSSNSNPRDLLRFLRSIRMQEEGLLIVESKGAP